MKFKIQLMSFVVLLTIAFCVVFGSVQFLSASQNQRYIDHIQNKKADPSIGSTVIPKDHLVDSSFQSHLPLIVIDTNGQEVKNYKQYNSATDAFEVPDGIDPYFDIEMSVYDNPQHINTLSQKETLSSKGKIKVRGNSSSSTKLPKFQYSIKLYNDNKEKNKVNLLGMGEESDWILNPTIRDISYIRNYLAFNIAGQIEPYQSDMRFCEVLLKEKTKYQYIGLYMLYEPVEVSKERVDISKNASKYNVGSGYLLKKDRYDKNAVTLNTWATQKELYYIRDDKTQDVIGKSFFTLEYPKKLNKETVDTITNELSQIEKLLYNDEMRDFDTLEKYLDIGSFVDYFIINEFFASYDAGQHSTFMYKDSAGKLTMGPYWDFDGAMDNSKGSLTTAHYMVLPYRPWFDCLIKTKEFVKRVEKRYKELRKGLLSQENLEQFIDDAQAYLGHAITRDRSVYNYYYDLQDKPEVNTNIIIDRKRYTVTDETLRVKDFLYAHGQYMDKHIHSLEQFVVEEQGKNDYNTLLAFGFILTVLISIVLVQRYRYLK